MIEWVETKARKATVEDGNDSGLVLVTDNGGRPMSTTVGAAPAWQYWARINPPRKPQSEVEKCKAVLYATGLYPTAESRTTVEQWIALIRAVRDEPR